MKKFNMQPTLKGEHLNLRPLLESDFQALFEAASDPLIWEQHPFSDRYKLNVFTVFFVEAIRSQGALVAIDGMKNKIIGTSRFYELNLEKKVVVIGYSFLKRDFWGGLYNREMKKLMLSYANENGINVEFHVDQRNLRSQKAMEKLGALKVGYLQKDDLSGGRRTTIIYVLPSAL